jgi:hypothetical protein
MARFYVIDGDNNASYSEKKDAAESFKTEAAAARRARELAEIEPGETFYICQAVHEVRCAVSSPVIRATK